MTYKKENAIRSIASVPSSIQPRHKKARSQRQPHIRDAIVILAMPPRTSDVSAAMTQVMGPDTDYTSRGDDASFGASVGADSAPVPATRSSLASMDNADSNYDTAFEDDDTSDHSRAAYDKMGFGLALDQSLHDSVLPEASSTPLSASTDSVSSADTNSTNPNLSWEDADSVAFDLDDSHAPVLGPLPHWWGEEQSGTCNHCHAPMNVSSLPI